VQGGHFRKLAKTEAPKIPSKGSKSRGAAEGGHSAERGGAAGSSPCYAEHTAGDELSHVANPDILFRRSECYILSLSPDGTIC
jgi:hypothetical protein